MERKLIAWILNSFQAGCDALNPHANKEKGKEMMLTEGIYRSYIKIEVYESPRIYLMVKFGHHPSEAMLRSLKPFMDLDDLGVSAYCKSGMYIQVCPPESIDYLRLGENVARFLLSENKGLVERFLNGQKVVAF